MKQTSRRKKTEPIPRLPVVLPAPPAPAETAAEKEKRLRELIESAERINKDHPNISVKKAMLLLNPLPRRAYSLQETAQILGLSYNTVYRLVQRRKLHALSVTRNKLVTIEEIERFLGQPGLAQ